MKKTVKILSACTLAAFSVCSYSEAAPDANTSILQQTITATMDKYQIPGMAVALVVEGKPYEYYAGYADREKKDPISNKTIFEVGSISKVMTSLLLAQEVDWAKMSLSDPVNKYVKDLPESWNEVKLQDLATHISGLPMNPPANVITREDMQSYLLGLKPGSEDRWEYSNVGVGLLGYALEASTEKEFDKLYYRHIMNPLGMVSGVTIPAKLVKYYAQGYDRTGNPIAHLGDSTLPAAISIKASGNDMQKFLNAAIGLPGTPPRIFYPMRMTQSVYVKIGNDFQGLGWQIHPIINKDVSALSKVTSAIDFGPTDIDEVYDRPTFDGDALIDKTGTTSGFRAYIAVLPNKKSGIVILANKNVPNSAIVAPAREILFKLTKLKA